MAQQRRTNLSSEKLKMKHPQALFFSLKMNSEKTLLPITSITSSLTRNNIPSVFICNFTISFHPKERP
jgi:hypothetical protein